MDSYTASLELSNAELQAKLNDLAKILPKWVIRGSARYQELMLNQVFLGSITVDATCIQALYVTGMCKCSLNFKVESLNLSKKFVEDMVSFSASEIVPDYIKEAKLDPVIKDKSLKDNTKHMTLRDFMKMAEK